MQVSLFDKDSLVTTQNIRIGNLRIRERVAATGAYVAAISRSWFRS